MECNYGHLLLSNFQGAPLLRAGETPSPASLWGLVGGGPTSASEAPGTPALSAGDAARDEEPSPQRGRLQEAPTAAPEVLEGAAVTPEADACTDQASDVPGEDGDTAAADEGSSGGAEPHAEPGPGDSAAEEATPGEREHKISMSAAVQEATADPAPEAEPAEASTISPIGSARQNAPTTTSCGDEPSWVTSRSSVDDLPRERSMTERAMDALEQAVDALEPSALDLWKVETLPHGLKEMVRSSSLSLPDEDEEVAPFQSSVQEAADPELQVAGRLDAFFADDHLWRLAYEASATARRALPDGKASFRVQVPKPYPGVQYRKSENLEDRHPQYAANGITVRGKVVDGGEWLMIKSNVYLPMRVGAVRILEPVGSGPVEEQIPATAAKCRCNTCC